MNTPELVSYWPVALGIVVLGVAVLVATWLAERKIQIDAADAWEDGMIEGATRVAGALPVEDRILVVVRAHRDALAEREAGL